MTAHALYTQTLSEYKSRLISSPCLTLRSYCHECHVNYHGMELWLSRHGIRIRELRSSLSASSSEKPVPCFSPLVPSSAPSARPSSSSDMLWDSPYNTYLNTGLPPGPICMPGEDAIQAALYPEPNCNYLYFCATGIDGGTAFAVTAAEQQQKRRT